MSDMFQRAGSIVISIIMITSVMMVGVGVGSESARAATLSVDWSESPPEQIEGSFAVSADGYAGETSTLCVERKRGGDVIWSEVTCKSVFGSFSEIYYLSPNELGISGGDEVQLRFSLEEDGFFGDEQVTNSRTTVYNRAPTTERLSPGETIEIQTGETVTFEVETNDQDDNLQGVDWYVNGGQVAKNSEVSDGTDTATFERTFNSEGNYGIGAQAYDTEGAYDENPSGWDVNVCTPGLDVSPSERDLGEFNINEDYPTVRIDIENSNNCGELNWQVTNRGLFEIVERGDDYIVVRPSDAVVGSFDNYVEIGITNSVVEDDGFERVDITGVAREEPSGPSISAINPSGGTYVVGSEVRLNGQAEAGSDGIPDSEFPAGDPQDLEFIWKVDGEQIDRSSPDSVSGGRAQHSTEYEFDEIGSHEIQLIVEDQVTGKRDTVTQDGFIARELEVTGAVTNKTSGEPVPGATVSLENKNNQVVGVAETTSAGEYRVTADEPGTYVLRTDSPKLATFEEKITLDGENVDKNIQLEESVTDRSIRSISYLNSKHQTAAQEQLNSDYWSQQQVGSVGDSIKALGPSSKEEAQRSVATDILAKKAGTSSFGGVFTTIDVSVNVLESLDQGSIANTLNPADSAYESYSESIEALHKNGENLSQTNEQLQTATGERRQELLERRQELLNKRMELLETAYEDTENYQKSVENTYTDESGGDVATRIFDLPWYIDAAIDFTEGMYGANENSYETTNAMFKKVKENLEADYYYTQAAQYPERDAAELSRVADGESSPIPKPKIVSVKQKSDDPIVPGEPTTIEVTVENSGQTDASIQTINLGFPDADSPDQIEIVDTSIQDPEYQLVSSPGDELGTGYFGEKRSISYPVAEVGDSWESGQRQTLTVRVTPKESGEFRYYVKSVARPGGYSSDPARSQEGSDVVTDEQGERSYLYTINVAEKDTPRSICASCDAPTDPDNDGLYEDINGDGEFGYFDVVRLFRLWESGEEIEQIELVDFEDDGEFTYFDVVRLFREWENK